MSIRVKIWGMKRSGTNVLHHVLEQLPGVEVLVGNPQNRGGVAWKHGEPKECRPEADFHIVSIKDPWAWQVSQARYDDPAGEVIHGIDDWAELNAKYIGFVDALNQGGRLRGLAINYHAWLRDPGANLRAIGGLLGLSTEGVKLPERPTGFNGDERAGEGKFDATPYTQRRYLDWITPADAERIRRAMAAHPAAPEFLSMTGDDPRAVDHDFSPCVAVACALNGMGDHLCALWVAAAIEDLGKRVIFYGRRAPFCGHWTAESRPLKHAGDGTGHLRPDVVALAAEGRAYAKSMRQMCEGGMSRLETYADRLPDEIKAELLEAGLPAFRQPELRIELPDSPAGTAGSALLFPLSAWRQRAWSIDNWSQLHKRLEFDGIPNMAMCEKGKGEQIKPIGCRWHGGERWPALFAAIKAARVVVSNDSGPAHLAGALGVPCVAISALVAADPLWRHYPTVEGLEPEDSLCSPCFYRKDRGFRDLTCRGHCGELGAVTPQRVYAAVRRHFPDAPRRRWLENRGATSGSGSNIAATGA